MLIEAKLRQIISARFPPVQYAVAYGSGVFQQPTTSSKYIYRLTDLLFCVTDPLQWHHDNLSANPSHYSSIMQRAGPSMINKIQNCGSGGVFFNCNINLDNDMAVKYGVIDAFRAIDDLKCWSDLYFAGRLHKPVVEIVENDQMRCFNAQNRLAALAWALHKLEPAGVVSWNDVLKEIVSLSYQGDIRMWLGVEDKMKVERIVRGQRDLLVSIYRPYLRQLGVCQSDGDFLKIDGFSGISFYPSKVNVKCNALKSSTVQAVKGLLTAPPSTAFDYVIQKIKKRNLP